MEEEAKAEDEVNEADEAGEKDLGALYPPPLAEMGAPLGEPYPSWAGAAGEP